MMKVMYHMKIHNKGTKYAYIEHEFSDLVGKTLTNVLIGPDEDRITFETEDGAIYLLSHTQDCCEYVTVESVVGDLTDLIGTPVLVANERASSDDPPNIKELKEAQRKKDEYNYDPESQTWTFYTLRTIKGTVDIRWYGTSNG